MILIRDEDGQVEAFGDLISFIKSRILDIEISLAKCFNPDAQKTLLINRHILSVLLE